jgi:hypothetical protein
MMKRERSVRRELLGAVLSLAVSFIGAVDLIGHPARMLHVLTIFAGGLGAGVTLGRALDRFRSERRPRAPAADDA